MMLGRHGSRDPRRELRVHISNQKHKVERVNWKWGEAITPQILPQETYFL